MFTIEFINAALFLLGMLFAFVAGRAAERKYWVNKAREGSDY